MSLRSTRKNSSSAESPQPCKDLGALLKESNREVLASINSLREEIGSLRKSFASLDERILKIEKSVSTFHERQAKCESDITEIKTVMQGVLASRPQLMSDVLREMEMREHRRENLMIYGLPEPTDGSLTERKQHDETVIRELLQEVDVSNVRLLEARRVGRVSEDRPRPVKIKLENRHSKYEILKKAKTLRESSHFGNVYIRNDLTKFQQDEYSALRKELQQRKEAGEDVVIYNGQIRSRDSLQNFRIRF